MSIFTIFCISVFISSENTWCSTQLPTVVFTHFKEMCFALFCCQLTLRRINLSTNISRCYFFHWIGITCKEVAVCRKIASVARLYIRAFGTFGGAWDKASQLYENDIQQIGLQRWIVQTWGPEFVFSKNTNVLTPCQANVPEKSCKRFMAMYRNVLDGFMFANVTLYNDTKFRWNGFVIQLNKRFALLLKFRSGIHTSRSNEGLSFHGRLHLKRRVVPCQLFPETSLIHYSSV